MERRKIALIDGVLSTVRAGGTVTYYSNYLLPILVESGFDVSLVVTKKVGSPTTREVAEQLGVEVITINDYSTGAASEIMEKFDAVVTLDPVFFNNNDDNEFMFNVMKETSTDIICTIHTTPAFLIKNTYYDRRFSVVRHPNMKHMVVFREPYMKRIPDMLEAYDATFELTDDNFSLHQPYVGYLDTSKLLPWDERPNKIAYIGRTAGNKKFYQFMRMVHAGNATKFDGYVYATTMDDAGHWDVKKYHDELANFSEEDKEKWTVVDPVNPEDLVDIANMARYIVVPTAFEGCSCLGEWISQEAALAGLVPMQNESIKGTTPTELMGLEDFLISNKRMRIYQSTINPDEYIEGYTEESLSKLASDVREYAEKYFNDKSLVVNSFIKILDSL